MLGVLPGVIGVIQATEAIKLITGIGEPLIGRFLIYDALRMRFRELKLRKDPDCPVCGTHPTVTKLIDYEQFCGLRPAAEIRSCEPEHASAEITSVELKSRLDSGDARADCRRPGAERVPDQPHSGGRADSAWRHPEPLCRARPGAGDRRALQDRADEARKRPISCDPSGSSGCSTSRAGSSTGSIRLIRRSPNTKLGLERSDFAVGPACCVFQRKLITR